MAVSGLLGALFAIAAVYVIIQSCPARAETERPRTFIDTERGTVTVPIEIWNSLMARLKQREMMEKQVADELAKRQCL
jgi:hypothetical protein